MADIVHPRDPLLEFFEATDGPILAAINLCLTRLFGARGGKRLRRSLVARGFVLLVASGLARCAPSPACGEGRDGGAAAAEEVAARIALGRNRVAGFVDLLGKRERREDTRWSRIPPAFG